LANDTPGPITTDHPAVKMLANSALQLISIANRLPDSDPLQRILYVLAERIGQSSRQLCGLPPTQPDVDGWEP
jgi:hypothetical protein